MKIKLTKQKLYIILCLCIIGLFIYISDNPITQILLFTFQFALIASSIKFEFVNPLFWFLGAFTIYSIAYPVLYATGLNMTIGYSPEPLRWNWIAMTTFYLFFSSTKIKQNNSFADVKWINKSVYKWFIILSGILVLLSIMLIRRIGYISKNEIYSGGNIIINFTLSLIYIVHTIYICLISINYKNNKNSIGIIVYVGLLSLLLTMFSGERDILLRFILITAFCSHIYGRITKKRLLIYFAIIIILFPITSMLKYYFLSYQLGEIKFSFSVKSIIWSLFGGEFESASKNLQILANDKDNIMGVLSGASYISDIVRIIGISIKSSLQWFNKNYYASSTVGHGFTIVGEGLVNFGLVGILLNFMILSLSLSYMYKNVYSKEIYNSIYTLSIPIFIYAIRADFANILSPIVRQIIIPILIFNIIVHKEEISEQNT